MTFAIGDPGSAKVSLWCEGTPKPRKDGSIRFYVINGAWHGVLRDGLVLAERYPDRTWPGALLWSGDVPRPHGGDYNSAIAWIDAQLASPPQD